MRKFAAGRPVVAKISEQLANPRAAQSRIVPDAGFPVGRPAQVLHQFARQAKWEIESAHPIARLREPVRKRFERLQLLKAVQPHCAATELAARNNDPFMFAGAAAEIATDQRLAGTALSHRVVTARTSCRQRQARPMMDAVAISSSSKASDTLPDTA